MQNNKFIQPFALRGDLSPDTFRHLLKYCADQGASDILVQGGDYIWIEVHGRQYKVTDTTIKQGQLSALLSSVWQAEVESNIRAGRGADRALEISGEQYGLSRGKYLRFRCNFVQARIARQDEAFAITLRLLPNELPNILKMGIEQDLFDALYPGMGLILVCGPTGSGKTTLLAGIYSYAGTQMPDRKVITYEDPIEIVLGGPHWLGPQPAQSQIGRDIENFALGLKNAMRRKPSIIGIGEARDLETVDAVVEAGLTGHLCYATVHTESVAETISRIIQVYPPEQQSSIASRLMGTLRAIIVQRLLKTTDGKRVAIREYLVFDRELRNQLQTEPYQKWGKAIRIILEKNKMTLDDKAWSLYCQGVIDKEEFIELAGMLAFNQRKAINE